MYRPNQILYVAGPMTGLPDHNWPAFARATDDLRRAGYFVYSPAEIVEERGAELVTEWDGVSTFTPSQRARVMRECFRAIVGDGVTYPGVDGVALLDGWESSAGARAEVEVASQIGARCAPVGDWLIQAGYRRGFGA